MSSLIHTHYMVGGVWGRNCLKTKGRDLMELISALKPALESRQLQSADLLTFPDIDIADLG